MSAEMTKFLVPPDVAMPRGAAWASALGVALARLGRAIWRGLEAVGEARANRELRRLAVMYADQPEFAKTLREATHRSAMHRDSQH